MAEQTCDDCGEPVPTEAASCPACGARLVDDSEEPAGVEGSEAIDEAAESFRSDQWKTYLIATTVGLVVASGLVGMIVYQAFLNRDSLMKRGPDYPDSAKGARAYLQKTVLPQLEMKYSKEGGPSFTCEQTQDVTATEETDPSVYETRVRCESSDQTLEIDVEILHGKHSMDRNTRVESTTEE